MTRGEIRFDGRAFLVTGAGRGLGRAQAILLAARGAKVVVADNGTTMGGGHPDRGPAEAVVADIATAGGEAVACTVDIATEQGANRAVGLALEAFGRIDGIAHYASTSPDPCPPDQVPPADLDLVMRVNQCAGLWMVQAAWSHMVKQRYGRLLLVPSAAIYGAGGNAPYATAKSAYIGMVRCLALDGAGAGITANAIMPAARSRMTERFHPSAFAEWFLDTMQPEQVAVGAAYLMSEACAVSGETFALGGGRIARVTLAESHGVLDTCATIEDVHSAMPRVLGDTDFFHPRDLGERTGAVSRLLGFSGAGESGQAYLVRPADGD